MANLGPEHVKYAWHRGEAFKKRLASIQDRLRHGTKKVVRSLEVSAAGAVGGLIQGRAGEEGSTVMHIPTDLLGGIVLNGLGFFGAAGDYSDHLHNFGDGLLAAFTSSMGYGWGSNWRKTGKFSFAAKPSELLPGTTTKGEISPGQMADIVARVKAAAGGM
jgi:hypothetical protein